MSKRLVAMLLVGLYGCNSTPNELSVARQVSLVIRGESDTIQIETQSITDQDLSKLSRAIKLRTLLIDNPDSRITAEGIKRVSGHSIEHLRLRGPGIDDVACSQIGEIKSLRILNLPKGEFTDYGLSYFRELPDLVQLRFHSPRISDAGLGVLAHIPALKRLHLIDIPITDDGLRTLASMRQLESLYIDGGNISDAAYEDLFRQRPDLHVHINQQHHDRDPRGHEHP